MFLMMLIFNVVGVFAGLIMPMSMAQVAVCPSLTLPTNGMSIIYNPPGSPTSQGTVATYQCITGYAPNPSTRTCQSDETWSGGETTCDVNVASPTHLAIGYWNIVQDTTIPITDVGQGGPSSPALACFITSYSIAEWYYPGGNPVPIGIPGPNVIVSVRQSSSMAITLNRGVNVLSPDGLYCCGSPVLPVDQRLCINLLAVCPSLTLPTNGMSITYNPPGSPTSQGTVATYQCITGYTPNPSTRTCQSDVTWSGGETTCQPVDCGQPPNITNGSPGTPDRTTFGGTVTYTCEDGLTLLGQAMITCMAIGMWSTPPSCPVPPVFLSLSSTNYFNNNSEILISSIGETDADALVCHTDLTTCCRASDGEAAGEWQFPNGTIIVSRVNSTSNDNYFRSKDAQLTRLHRRNNDMTVGLYCCVIPTSRGTETFCANLISSLLTTTTTTTTTTSTAPPIFTCPDLTVQANGMITYNSGITNARPVGSTATYNCVNGYTLNGDITRTCQSDGNWSGRETTCDPPPAVLSLGSTNYLVNVPNIPLSSVGKGANSLNCRTDDSNCCRVEDAGVVKGAWHYPNGSVVSSDSGDLYTTREGPMVVSLNRRDGVDGPTGLYCCVVPTSTGTRPVCSYLGSPLSQSDNTGAIVGGVVALILGLVLILAITAIVIAYLVLRQRKPQGVNSKRDQPDIRLTDKGQSTPPQTYDTVDTTCTYEEIDGARPLQGNYDYTQNEAYATKTAPLKREGVVNTGESGTRGRR